ncbi:MAG: HEAT repeat domain-containing protein [Deltaproteobacteria bacterium]|nr:MAG: HEAT repeat domain-containing protein [Deltaproteobacteria bacterium]
MSRASLLLALSALACKPAARPGALRVSLVVSEAGLAGKPEIGETAAQLRGELQQVLEGTGRFSVREGGPVQVRMEIDRVQRVLAPAPMVLPAQPPGPDREMADVAITLEMTSMGAQGDVDRLVAEGEARRPTGADDSLDPAARHAAFDAALDAALHEAVIALRDQVDARRKTEKELLADLASPEARVRDYAIRVLADRRSPAAVPQLITRLQDENPEVARRAAGALIAIGDRRAVVPLIEMTRKRRSEDVGPILYAIGSLGGSEAEAFLFTLESGSPDEEIRRAARGAYQDLLRKKQEDAARVSDGRKAP